MTLELSVDPRDRRWGAMGATALPQSHAIKTLIARLRDPAVAVRDLVSVRDQLLRELATATLLVIVRELPPGVGRERAALPESVPIEVLATTLPDGRRMMPVFTDANEIEARRPAAAWVGAPGRRWMEVALADYDGLVVNPAGVWWELDADDLRQALGPEATLVPHPAPRFDSAASGQSRAGPVPRASTSALAAPALSLPLDLERARDLARTHAKGLVIDNVIEREWGWAFTFDGPEHARSGRPQDMLVGAGPLLVNRHNGSVRSCGSAMPVTAWIAEYERDLQAGRGGIRRLLRRWLGGGRGA